MKKILLHLTPVLVLLALAVSCGSSDEEAIEEVLSRRQKAFEAKDVELYMSCIAPNYSQRADGKVIGVEDIKKDFMDTVSVFDRIKLSHYDRSISQDGKKAEVFQKVRVNLQIEKEENEFSQREKLGLEKINGKWVIVKESDVDLFRGFVFGG